MNLERLRREQLSRDTAADAAADLDELGDDLEYVAAVLFGDGEPHSERDVRLRLAGYRARRAYELGGIAQLTHELIRIRDTFPAEDAADLAVAVKAALRG
jgi:hypothetical protein